MRRSIQKTIAWILLFCFSPTIIINASSTSTTPASTPATPIDPSQTSGTPGNAGSQVLMTDAQSPAGTIDAGLVWGTDMDFRNGCHDDNGGIPPNSTYFDPKITIRKRGDQLLIPDKYLTIGAYGDCGHIDGYRICARPTNPGEYGNNDLDANKYTCPYDKYITGGYGKVGINRVRICAYEDPMDGMDTHSFFSPFQHDTPTDSQAKDVGSLLTHSSLSVAASTGLLGISALMAIAGGMADLIGLITSSYNHWVIRRLACACMPLAPSPPPFCPSILSSKPIIAEPICRQMDFPLLKELSTYGSACSIGVDNSDPKNLQPLYSSFEYPVIRVNYPNLVPLCQNDITTYETMPSSSSIANSNSTSAESVEFTENCCNGKFSSPTPKCGYIRNFTSSDQSFIQSFQRDNFSLLNICGSINADPNKPNAACINFSMLGMPDVSYRLTYSLSGGPSFGNLVSGASATSNLPFISTNQGQILAANQINVSSFIDTKLLFTQASLQNMAFSQPGDSGIGTKSLYVSQPFDLIDDITLIDKSFFAIIDPDSSEDICLYRIYLNQNSTDGSKNTYDASSINPYNNGGGQPFYFNYSPEGPCISRAPMPKPLVAKCGDPNPYQCLSGTYDKVAGICVCPTGSYCPPPIQLPTDQCQSDTKEPGMLAAVGVITPEIGTFKFPTTTGSIPQIPLKGANFSAIITDDQYNLPDSSGDYTPDTVDGLEYQSFRYIKGGTKMCLQGYDPLQNFTAYDSSAGNIDLKDATQIVLAKKINGIVSTDPEDRIIPAYDPTVTVLLNNQVYHPNIYDANGNVTTVGDTISYSGRTIPAGTEIDPDTESTRPKTILERGLTTNQQIVLTKVDANGQPSNNPQDRIIPPYTKGVDVLTDDQIYHIQLVSNGIVVQDADLINYAGRSAPGYTIDNSKEAIRPKTALELGLCVDIPAVTCPFMTVFGVSALSLLPRDGNGNPIGPPKTVDAIPGYILSKDDLDDMTVNWSYYVAMFNDIKKTCKPPMPDFWPSTKNQYTQFTETSNQDNVHLNNYSLTDWENEWNNNEYTLFFTNPTSTCMNLSMENVSMCVDNNKNFTFKYNQTINLIAVSINFYSILTYNKSPIDKAIASWIASWQTNN